MCALSFTFRPTPLEKDKTYSGSDFPLYMFGKPLILACHNNDYATIQCLMSQGNGFLCGMKLYNINPAPENAIKYDPLESNFDTAQTLSLGLATRCHYCYGYYIKYVVTTWLLRFINHHNFLFYLQIVDWLDEKTGWEDWMGRKKERKDLININFWCLL